MTIRNYSRSLLPLTAAAGLGLITGVLGQTTPAQAQSGGGITWRGNVDNVTQIVVQGSSVNASAVSGRQPTNVTFRRTGSPATRSSSITLQRVEGRGQVRVVQSPDANNNYTTIVEVRDPQSGDAPYEFRLLWNQSSNSGGTWGGGYGDRRNDDRWDDYGKGRGNGRDGAWGGYGDRTNNGRGNGGRDNRRRDDRRPGNWRNEDRRDRDDRRDGGEITAAERAAYQAGIMRGRMDAQRNQKRDYAHYRSLFNARTEAAFRRGYNNGFDDGAFRRGR